MRKVLHLTQEESTRLIFEALRAKGYQVVSGGPLHVDFVREKDGTIGTLIENIELVEEDVAPPEKTAEALAVANLAHSRVVDVTDQVLFREGAEGDVEELTGHAIDILQDHHELESGNQKTFRATLEALMPRVETALRELEQTGRAQFVEAGADDEDDDAYWRAKRPLRKAKDRACMVAEAQRDTKDYISGEPIKGGTPCVFVSDVGATVTHPDDWPDDLRQKIDPSPAEVLRTCSAETAE
jgi:hypothetical protein